MAVLAKAKGMSISPKKLRWIVQSVRGMKVSNALDILKFLPSPAAREVAKVVKSAAANAENNFMLNQENLKIVSIFADKGFGGHFNDKGNKIISKTIYKYLKIKNYL